MIARSVGYIVALLAGVMVGAFILFAIGAAVDVAAAHREKIARTR